MTDHQIEMFLAYSYRQTCRDIEPPWFTVLFLSLSLFPNN